MFGLQFQSEISNSAVLDSSVYLRLYSIKVYNHNHIANCPSWCRFSALQSLHGGEYELQQLWISHSRWRTILSELRSPEQPHKKRSSAGIFVVIGVGCFLALIFLGIIAAIAIPNLLNAIQRAKQKRTMVDIRSIAIACEAYATDHHAYPDVDSVDELVPILEPKYIKKLPQMDAWNGILLYEARNNSGSSDGPDEYFIVSTGKDRLLDQGHLDYPEPVSTTSFNNDIVFTNGGFVQYPE